MLAQFEPEGQDRHSSSIVDLIDSCKSAVAFVQNLQWPDKRANALYLTRLAQVRFLCMSASCWALSIVQTISKAIEEYCAKIEQLFMAEMFPRIAEEPETDEKTSAWLIKAKGLYSGFGKQTAQPFSFKAEVRPLHFHSIVSPVSGDCTAPRHAQQHPGRSRPDRQDVLDHRC